MHGIGDKYDKTAGPNYSIRMRNQCPILHLRDYNNWVKSSVIDHFCPFPNAVILDLACGKGGDIPKFRLKNPSQMVFADCSLKSLERAFEKFQKMSDSCKATFIHGDSFGNDITKVFTGLKFHFASCQFALHYSFKAFDTAYCAVRNLCSCVHEGGYCFITIPNSLKLVELFREHGRFFQNSVLQLKCNFDPNNPIPPFGAGYNFTLAESVDDLEEFLVHPKVLTSLLKEFNFDLVKKSGFHEYYQECLDKPEMKSLFHRLLEIGNFEATKMTKDEWFVCGLYSLFVFKKRGEPTELRKEAIYKGLQTSWTMRVYDACTGSVIDRDIVPTKKINKK